MFLQFKKVLKVHKSFKQSYVYGQFLFELNLHTRLTKSLQLFWLITFVSWLLSLTTTENTRKLLLYVFTGVE